MSTSRPRHGPKPRHTVHKPGDTAAASPTSLRDGSSQVESAMQPASGCGWVSAALYATWPP